LIGQVLKERNDRPLIATKCGLAWDDPNERNVTPRLKADSVKREAEASLQRLGIETIDLYQIHWPNPDGDIEEAWRAIDELKQSGKVRHAGVSNCSVAQIERLQGIAPVASLQPPFSLLDRAVQAETLPFCAEQRIGVIAYGAMAYGLLTGKFTKAAAQQLPPDDWRRRGGRFQEPEFGANLDFVEGLKALADGLDRPVSHLAIAWCVQQVGVTAAIVGARRPDQIEQTAGAGDLDLSDDTLKAIDGLLQRRAKRLGTYKPKVPV
jgi:aryl-alcohol dehydrogenase-like predicted oxidoreductase